MPPHITVEDDEIRPVVHESTATPLPSSSYPSSSLQQNTSLPPLQQPQKSSSSSSSLSKTLTVAAQSPKSNHLTASPPNTLTRRPTQPQETTAAASRAFILGGRLRRGPHLGYDDKDDRRAKEQKGKQVDKSRVSSDEKDVSSSDPASTSIEIPVQSSPTSDPSSVIAKTTDPEKGLENTLPENDHQDHVPTWTERMHGQRPDRHLFPYRSTKENMRAVRTFFRRFFLILLIIPAWVLPNVLTAKMLKEQAEEGGGHGGGGAHGPELSKGVNLAIFFLNMLAMMHLGKAAGAALEELVPRFGISIVSVFDAMTSSSIELAVAAFALKNGLIVVVQAAMLGAILNNLLLILGIAITVGGAFHSKQRLNKETTNTSINILLLTTLAYVVPIALELTLTNIHRQQAGIHDSSRSTHLSPEAAALLKAQELGIRQRVDADILQLSKIMSFILLIVYGTCLYFQYKSRTFIVTPEGKHEGAHTVDRRYTHFWFAGLAYAGTMAAQIYSAKWLVHAVESLGRQFHLNDSFVGFVLLPIMLVADLQEEVIAIRESRSNRLDKTVALMVGSCMQISLLVTPILVLLGWILDEPMTLRFTVLEVAILAGSVTIVNNLITDNETNWLEGCLLLAMFMMCAIAFYYDVAHLNVLPGEGSTVGGDNGSVGGH
ncbi:hypothetical protein BGW38_002919 [Lunasporangiospora selenospora]|uniref:Sodium/calcium exchanger membrane region domain-containing protein n=1 Tax=Lunasporangiospora selenospora TaxID=979761 RepID=A0A9P6FS37_9FUNG|nr:hypothetical protein BGW38_002919 [Lunasporangiospora selenospora]